MRDVSAMDTEIVAHTHTHIYFIYIHLCLACAVQNAYL